MNRKLISLLSAFSMLAAPAAQLCVLADAEPVDAKLISFDYDDTQYFTAKGSSKLEISSEAGYASDRSLKVSGRSSAGDGASLKVKAAGKPAVYTVSLWVRTNEASKITAELGGKKVNSANARAGEWTKLAGKVEIEDESASLDLDVFCLNGTGDLYIDNVSVLADGEVMNIPLMPEGMNMLTNGDFEAGAAEPFSARSCTNTVQASSARDGSYGVSVSGRDQGWQGIQYDIKDLVVEQCSYEASAWIRLDDPSVESADFYLQLEVTEPGADTQYPSIARVTAKNGEWTQVTGVFSTNNFFFPLSGLSMYIGSADDNTCDFSVDDVTLSYTTKIAGGYSDRPADAHPWVNKELTPLKDVYKDYFMIGTARGSDVSESAAVEDEMIGYHFDIFTAGNAMKPDAIAPRRGKFTYDVADYMIAQAEQNNVKTHGHVFVWHEQTPTWINTDVSREEALQNLHDYIFTVAEHFKGKCYSWDVVNEAIDGITDTSTLSGILRNTPWRRAIGDDYIEYAFKYASEALPDADLYYNDFNLDDAHKADAVVTLVKDLQSKGIKIDGVGMQAHYNTNTSITAVENSIKKFRDLGVKISISELDVNCYSMLNGEFTHEDEVLQAQKYAQLFKLFKKYSDVIDRVTLWGIDDATSWRSESYPLIFDKDYQPKEAYYAVIDPEGYLEEHPVKAKSIDRGVAVKGTPVIDGEIDELWSSAPEINVNKYVMAWQGATGVARTLWDEDNLYVLFDVTDPLLSVSGSETYLQDSVEIFVDENDGKTTYFEDDDRHFRVSCENLHSFGTNGTDDGFITAAKKTDKGYLVEMAVPWLTKRTAPGIIGFEAQVNDDSKGDGNRTSITKFSDTSDLSWSSTENFGELILSEDGTTDSIFVVLNGRTLTFDVPPTIINDRTMVPFRKILEELDAEVNYNADGQYVTAKNSETEITMQIGSTAATVNGESVEMDTAPVIIDGSTLIPVRYISEFLGAEVSWNGSNSTVTIEY